MNQTRTDFAPLNLKECMQDIRAKTAELNQPKNAFTPLDLKECMDVIRAKVAAMTHNTAKH